MMDRVTPRGGSLSDVPNVINNVEPTCNGVFGKPVTTVLSIVESSV